MSGGLQAGRDLLILLLDVPLLLENHAQHTSNGQQQPGQLQSSSLLEQVLYFVAAFLIFSDSNCLAVYGLLESSCEVLHASLGGGDIPEWPGANNPTRSIHARILDLVKRNPAVPEPSALTAGGGTSPSRNLALSAGLSRALCLIHRLQGASIWSGTAPAPASAGAGAPKATRPRILCVLSAPDVPAQYISTMNAIFSAQRAEVAIDTLMVGPTHSVYLQQAAHLTGGLYMHASGATGAGGTSSQSALQYLLSCMACDVNTRSMLCVHQPLGVDFRASCFCHKKPVDIGYVCSVCLSIFCTPRVECVTCGTVFTGGEGATAAKQAG